jgi:hypothetical protein
MRNNLMRQDGERIPQEYNDMMRGALPRKTQIMACPGTPNQYVKHGENAVAEPVINPINARISRGENKVREREEYAELKSRGALTERHIRLRIRLRTCSQSVNEAWAKPTRKSKIGL